MYLQCYRNKVHAKEVKELTFHTFRLQDTDNEYLISDMLYQELMSSVKEHETPICFATNHLLSNHTFANCLIWKTSVNCLSDLSRRDKYLIIL